MSQALLLMDIQQSVLDRVGGGEPYLDRVVAVQERAEAAGLLVVLVRVAFRPGHPEISQQSRIFSAVEPMVLGDPSVEPHPRLMRGNGEVVVTKKRTSAFTATDLEMILRSHNVTRLVLAGMSTGGVVLSTMRDAVERDYQITVLEDLCLDADEELHRVLMTKLFSRQADVIASADWRPA